MKKVSMSARIDVPRDTGAKKELAHSDFVLLATIKDQPVVDRDLRRNLQVKERERERGLATFMEP